MRRPIQLSFSLFSIVLFMSCASAVPPSRIGDYISPERQAGDEAFVRIEQRPLQAGLLMVSDTSAPGAAPNLPDEAFVRLGESLKEDLGRAIPVSIKEVIPADNILFASEMVGAVRGVDPETGQYYDDTKRYVDSIDWLSAADRTKIFHGNVAKVYPRFKARA